MLSGSIAGPAGRSAIQGTQKEKAVLVSFSVQTPNGPIAITMNGNQDGDALAGTMDLVVRARGTSAGSGEPGCRRRTAATASPG